MTTLLDFGHLLTLVVGAIIGGFVVHNNYKIASTIIARAQGIASKAGTAVKDASAKV